MSAPLVWIFLPGLAGVLFFVLRRSERVVSIIGVVFSFWLASTAWLMPVDEVINIGGFTLKLTDSFSILGRQFILTNLDRPFLAILFSIHAFWILGAAFAKPGEAFIPFTFVMLALLTAALAVEPFLYAGLLIEITVLFAIPLLSPPDTKPGRGVFRFLAFQTFGMPFILFTGWMLAGLEASPGDLQVALRAGVLLGVGFAFLLAVFPFHSWLPMLGEESHPYIAAFIFYILPGMVSLFGLGFIERFVWLRDSEGAYQLIRTIGMVMALVGGVMAAFEVHLGRMLGHAAIVETGLTLLAIGLGTREGLMIYFWLIIPRAAAFIIWAISLSRIKQRMKGELRLSNVQGLGRLRPILALSLLMAHFSLSGLPFLAGFPVRLVLWEQLAGVFPVLAVGAILGNVGMLAGGLRTMSVFFTPEEQELPQESQPLKEIPLGSIPITPERRLSWSYFGISALVITFLGLFPTFLIPALKRLVLMFEQLGG
jgi:formate hydrogenlyase subunit 3/multisubunit Na+/H+ antiporter MnhD subunit